MSSADILAFPHSEPFPPAQVLDLAVSVAIGRDLARSETEMFALIKDWFLRPATVGELAASIKRLLDCGSITRVSDGEFDFASRRQVWRRPPPCRGNDPDDRPGPRLLQDRLPLADARP